MQRKQRQLDPLGCFPPLAPFTSGGFHPTTKMPPMVLRATALLCVVAWLAAAENVLDAMRNDGELSSFYQLAERVRLFVVYSESSDITCFAPTNEAIQRFLERFPEKQIEPTYHVASLNVAQDNLPSAVPTITKGSPQLYLTRGEDKMFFVNNARVIRWQGMTHEGHRQKLYVIDDVLEAFVPTSGVTPDAFDFLKQPSIYDLYHGLNFFLSRVKMTHEQYLFTEDGFHTYFVPVDDADPARRTRVDMDKFVVQGHVIKNRRLFTRTMGNETYESAAWHSNVRVELSLTNQTDSAEARDVLFVQSNTLSSEPQRKKGVVISKIVKPNIPVKNGVVHLIEKPLMVVDTSIRDFLQRNRHGRVDDFVRLVDYSPDFQRDLNGNQPKTVFVPTNDALKVIPRSVLDALKINMSGLTLLLRLHMIKDEAVSTDEVLEYGSAGILERESASSRRGLRMSVGHGEHGRVLTVEGGGVNATAVQSDIGTTNGVIHIIDRVLGMPSHTIYEKVSSDPELRETKTFSQQNGWIDRLKDMGKRYTFFAPSDNAWHDFKLENPSEYQELSTDQFAYPAGQIMERHLVVGKEIPRAELEHLKSIETAGGRMGVRNVNGKIHLLWQGREAVIVRADVQATNGVIHVISKVMVERRDIISAATAQPASVAECLLGLAAAFVLWAGA
ncbi:fasciclin-1-like [Haemaphysalis longicornis]